jgi:hypothetical protein
MPNNSTTFDEWLTQAERRQAQALDSVNGATERARLAVEALGTAQAEAASCYLLVLDLPAYAICEVQAGSAVGASTGAIDHYNGKAREAAQAYKDISSAIERLHELLGAYQVAESGGKTDDMAQALDEGHIAYEGAEAVAIPDVSDNLLTDARRAIAELQTANGEAQQIATTPFI